MKKFKSLLIFLVLFSVFTVAEARLISLERGWSLVGIFKDMNSTLQLLDEVEVMWGYKNSMWYADSNRDDIKKYLNE